MKMCGDIHNFDKLSPVSLLPAMPDVDVTLSRIFMDSMTLVIKFLPVTTPPAIIYRR
jgi:hypothetical protein